MKYFIAIALIAAVASAGIVKPTVVTGELAQIQEILEAIYSPSTDPATAAALEQMLIDLLGADNFVPPQPEPISVGPAVVDVPESDGGAVTAEETPAVLPAVVAPAVPEVPAASSTPLVQIILNINQAAAGSPAAAPAGIAPVVPEAVSVVETAPEAVSVVETAPEVVSVVETAPEVVSVVDTAPEVVSVVDALPAQPIVVGEPALPSPVVVLPEILN